MPVDLLKVPTIHPIAVKTFQQMTEKFDQSVAQDKTSEISRVIKLYSQSTTNVCTKSNLSNSHGKISLKRKMLTL